MIYGHPAVSEVAVFGMSHPTWIEAVTAAVVLRSGQLADLPKNASGKVLKRDLRAGSG